MTGEALTEPFYLTGPRARALGLVARILGDADPDDFDGYIVIGALKGGGYQITTNAATDEFEAEVLRRISEHLKSPRGSR